MIFVVKVKILILFSKGLELQDKYVFFLILINCIKYIDCFLKVDNMGGGLGPKGVKITLTSQNEVRETVTNEEGGFYFTPVYPGTYVVSASHPK